MDKSCARCGELKPVSEYYPNKGRRDGLSAYCLVCDRSAVNASYQRLRDAALDHFGGRCRSCGYDADRRALAVDHVSGDGAAHRRGGGNRGRALLRTAMTDTDGRFQLLCCNCNNIKRIAEEERGARVYKRSAPNTSRVTKWCPKCQTEKSVADFGNNAARPDGLSSYCAACIATRTSAEYLALRMRVIAHLGSACLHCGYDADPRALQVDHVNGDGGVERKAGTVNRVILRAVLADTEGRYQLLCANCNWIKRVEGDERGSRVYARTVPTTRIDRPNERWTPESRAAQSERSRALWQSPEHRAAMSRDRSERMRKRWASGEVPIRRRARGAEPEGG